MSIIPLFLLLAINHLVVHLSSWEANEIYIDHFFLWLEEYCSLEKEKKNLLCCHFVTRLFLFSVNTCVFNPLLYKLTQDLFSHLFIGFQKGRPMKLISIVFKRIFDYNNVSLFYNIQICLQLL